MHTAGEARGGTTALAAAFAASLLGGCAALLDFDVTDDAGAGGATSSSPAAGPASTADGSTAGTGGRGEGGAGGEGGACGCVREGVCEAGDQTAACGRDGDLCTVCEATECTTPRCADGACAGDPIDDGTPCTGGTCVAGACEPNEDCTDGLDDDGDGVADCADDDCATFAACLPPAPPGWLGPFAVYEAAEPVACPEEWPAPAVGVPPLGHTVVPGEAACSPCTCTPICYGLTYFPGDTVCDAPMATDPAGYVAPGVCSAVPIADALPQSVLLASHYSACSGAAAGPDTLAPPSFATAITACTGTTSACSGGTCAPRVPDLPDAVEHTCVLVHSQVACPAEWPVQLTGYTSAYDGRSCSGCFTCTTSCVGAVEVYDTASCTTCLNQAQPCTDVALGECVPFASGGTLHVTYDGSEDTCTPAEQVVLGTVTPLDPWTACCLPPG